MPGAGSNTLTIYYINRKVKILVQIPPNRAYMGIGGAKPSLNQRLFLILFAKTKTGYIFLCR